MFRWDSWKGIGLIVRAAMIRRRRKWPCRPLDGRRIGTGEARAKRGWEALKARGWSIQKPRPRNPKAAIEAHK